MAKMRKALALLLALTLVLSLSITGLVLPASAEQTVLWVEDYEDEVYAEGINNWTTGGAIVDDPVSGSSNGKVLYFETAKNVYNGKGMGMTTPNKVYSLSIDWYGTNAMSIWFNAKKGYINSASVTTDATAEWKTITYYFVSTGSVTNDGFLMQLNAAAGTYIDNITVTELGDADEGGLAAYAGGVLPGGDFEQEDPATFMQSITSGATVVDDPAGGDNKVLYYPSTFTTKSPYYQMQANLAPNTTYTLSMDIYGGSIGGYFNAAKGITSGTGWFELAGTAGEWTTVSHVFTTGDSVTNDTNVFAIGAGLDAKMTDTYIDNVRITETKATAITLDQTTATVDIGSSVTITASPVPTAAPLPEIEWTTDNEAVATVDGGAVIGVGEGKAIITATAEGLDPVSCKVVVNDPAKMISETFEAEDITGNITGWTSKFGSTLAADPTDETNQVWKIVTTGSAQQGKALGFTGNKVYLASFRAYISETATNGKVRMSVGTSKNLYGGGHAIITETGKWVTRVVPFYSTADVKDDASTVTLEVTGASTSAPVYIDDISLIEVGDHDGNLLVGGDFELENYYVVDGSVNSGEWYDYFDYGATIEQDDEIEGNHALYFPSTWPAGRACYYKGTPNLKGNTAYKLTAKVKGGNLWMFTSTAKGFTYPTSWTKIHSGDETDKEWEEVTLYFTTGDTVANDQYSVGFGVATNYSTTGAYLDDVSIVEVGHAVSVTAPENGTVYVKSDKTTASKIEYAAAAAGDIVTVTVVPAEGYVMVPGTLKYTGVTSDTEVKILNETWETRPEWGRESAGNTFEFEMPDEPVTVTATFVSTAAQDFQMDSIGTAIRENGETDESGNTYYGIRFLTRMNLATTFNPETAGLSVTIDGEAHEVLKIGSTLTRDADGYEWDAVVYEKGGDMKLVDYTDSYIDFASVMKTVNIERTYTAQGYIVVDLNDDGVIGDDEYIYSINTQNDSVKTTAERLGITLNGTAQ